MTNELDVRYLHNKLKSGLAAWRLVVVEWKQQNEHVKL